MPTVEPHLVPDEYYSAKDIDRLFAALEKRIEAKEVMRADEAATFLSVSVTTLNVMCRKGLPYHRVEGLGGKMFLRTELIEYIKRS